MDEQNKHLASIANSLREMVCASYFFFAILVGILMALVGSCAKSAHAQSPAQVELGRSLFFERALSKDGSTSCGSCHDPNHGWSDGRTVAQGLISNGRGLSGIRNTPTIVAASKQQRQFHDQRSPSLTAQVTGPMLNPVEMNLPSIQTGLNRLAGSPGYQNLFASAFGSPGINQQRLELAVAAFESTIDGPVVADVLAAGGVVDISPAASRGAVLFAKSGCVQCHKPSSQWRDNLCHNTGYSSRTARKDAGRSLIAGAGPNNVNVRAFKTPTLKFVGRTAPYMHDGGVPTLRAVVDHYNAGAGFVGASGGEVRDQLADPRIKKLRLTSEQCDDLVAWLLEGFEGDFPTGRRMVAR